MIPSETMFLRSFAEPTGASERRCRTWRTWHPRAEAKESGFFKTRVLNVNAKTGEKYDFIASKSCKYHRKWMIAFLMEKKNPVRVVDFMDTQCSEIAKTAGPQ